MKKYILFSLFFFVACFSFSQESKYGDVFEHMQGIVVGKDTILKANGYSIRIKESIVPKSLFGTHLNIELFNWFKIASNEKERANYNKGNDNFLYNVGDIVVFRSTLKKTMWKMDSIASQETKYIYRAKKYHLKSIEFSKRGEVDSTYQLNIVNAIRRNGVPKPVMLASADTIDFFGKKIGLPINERNGLLYHVSNPKSTPNEHKYNASWDSYHAQEDAIRENGYSIANFVKDNRQRIVGEGKDTVLFQNRRILADRFDMKTYIYISKQEIQKKYRSNRPILFRPISIINL